MPSESEEVNVFQISVHLSEATAWGGFGIDADFVLAAYQVRGNNLHGFFQGFALGIRSDDFGPDAALDGFERLRRRAFDQEFAIADHGHARAQLADIVHDVSGENHDYVAADRA